MRYILLPSLLLVSCSTAKDTADEFSPTSNENGIPDTAVDTANPTEDAASLEKQWRELSITRRATTHFGKLNGDSYRINTGSFIGEFDSKKLTLRHRIQNTEANAEANVETSLEFSRWGRTGALKKAKKIKPALGSCISEEKDNCLRQLEFAEDDITTWFRGGHDAIEQGWDIKLRPEGSGELMLEVTLDGFEDIVVDTDQAEMLDSAGNRWIYDGLQAWDANDRELEIWLEEASNGLFVIVDDAQAATLLPLIRGSPLPVMRFAMRSIQQLGLMAPLLPLFLLLWSLLLVTLVVVVIPQALEELFEQVITALIMPVGIIVDINTTQVIQPILTIISAVNKKIGVLIPLGMVIVLDGILSV